MRNGVKIIPEMVDPLSKYWEQPKAEEIHFDNVAAVMDVSTFNELKDYSATDPTGKYVGKMWKSFYRGVWYLKWIHKIGDSLWIEAKLIRVIDKPYA